MGAPTPAFRPPSRRSAIRTALRSPHRRRSAARAAEPPCASRPDLRRSTVMSSKLKLLSATPLAALLLAGCDTLNQNNISPDPYFGEAAKYNAAAQTIDPDPVYA